MRGLVQIQDADRQLLDTIAATMEEAARRSGEWLVCRPGCIECCIGPFAITQLDALRLRTGLAALAQKDPRRAAAVRERADAYVAAIAPLYPRDPASGELFDEDKLPPEMDEMPCPALDPDTGCCDLYDARPMTCRTFGPATRVGEQTLVACELCYVGATDQEMARCAVEVDVEGTENRLLDALEAEGERGMTIVACALTSP